MTLKIGAIIYDVVKRHISCETVGHLDGVRQIIELNPEQNVNCAFNSVWHEACHDILSPLCLNNKLEEQIVILMANGITQILEDNPHLRQCSTFTKEFKKVKEEK